MAYPVEVNNHIPQKAFGRGSAYAELAYYYTPAYAVRTLQNDAGNLILALAVKDGDTKLFQRSIYPNNADFLWTYTVTRTPCETGLYICEILRVPLDKTDKPFYSVRPIVKLNETALDTGALGVVFAASSLFTEKDTSALFENGWNAKNMAEQVKTFLTECERPQCDDIIAAANHCVTLLLAGKITAEQIIAWLKEPTDEEKTRNVLEAAVSEFFSQDLEAMAATLGTPQTSTNSCYFPYLAKEYLRKLKNGNPALRYFSGKLDFIKNLQEKYEYNVSNGKLTPVANESILQQVESYLEFDAARKAARPKKGKMKPA